MTVSVSQNWDIRYIVYIEPNESSQLFRSITNYYAKTLKSHGHNQAHKYHPHISMTGFFLLKNNSQELENQLILTLSEIMNIESVSKLKPPIINGVECRQNVVRINVTNDVDLFKLCGLFKDLVREKFDEITQIRIKPMDHISLAYYKDEQYDKNLKELLDLAHSDIDLSKDNLWQISLYRVLYSDKINIPHHFSLLKRWNLSNEQISKANH
jgi:hypothetical protein